MPSPLPTPQELLSRQEAYFEEELTAYVKAKQLDVTPEAISRAVRSPVGIISAMARNNAQELYSVYLYLRYVMDQLLPDTAALENLIRHCGTWGIFQRPATKAVGYTVAVTGEAGVAIPKDLELKTTTGVTFAVLQAVTIGDDRQAILSLRALDAGSVGNCAGGTKLSLVTPIIGLDQQDTTFDGDGAAGGAETESKASLLERLLDKIRQPAHGGASFDYVNWVKNRFPAAHVRAISPWPEPGSVGVVVAMGSKTDPQVPTPAELVAMAEHLEGLRPVTAIVVMLAAEITRVKHRIALTPDTINIRQAVQSAITTFYARESTIAGTIYFSRLSEAISSASGEYAHTLHAPARDMTGEEKELLVPGPIEWETEP